MRGFVVAAAAAAVSLMLAGSANSSTDVGNVSHGDPFAACPIGQDIFGGVNYADTEPEPWLAHNPAVSNNFVGSYQQDRWDDGGAKGLVAAWSFDNGQSWGNTPLPFSKCAAPYYGGRVAPYDRASDPWDSIGPDGIAYAVSISFDANDNDNGVFAARSLDGGRSWRDLRPIVTDVDADPNQPFSDKESVTADPTRLRTAYVVWDRLVNRACGPAGLPAHKPETERPRDNAAARGAAPTAPVCYEGPAYFSRTTDGGRTWEPARPIVSTLVNEQTIGNEIVVDPRTGTLYDFYTYITEPGLFFVQMVFSVDAGTTWSPPQTVGEEQVTAGVYDPKTGDPVRTGAIIPQPAIDPRTGQLYVVWEDMRYNPATEQDQVVISTSTAGGFSGTWSPPTLVNPPGDTAAFTPAIVVNRRGDVAVTYYDFQSGRVDGGGHDGGSNGGSYTGSNGDGNRGGNGHTLPTDYWLATTDGPGVDFGRDRVHLSGPFNMLAAPFAGGYFLGDYEGLALDRNGRDVHPFWAQTNCSSNACAAVPSPTAAPLPRGYPDPMDVYSTTSSAEDFNHR